MDMCSAGLAMLALPALADDYDDGWAAIQNGDFDSAFTILKPLAEQGHIEAQFNLGVMYFQGDGVAKDDAAATNWFRKAAEQGHATAQTILAWRYEASEGVAQDYKQAARWYRMAALQGDAFAQNNLGIMYFEGRGVSADIKTSYMWFSLALHNGEARARDNIKLLEENMTPADISTARDMARTCLGSGYEDC